MVANIQKRGKGETEAKLFHLPIHPSVVFICLCCSSAPAVSPLAASSSLVISPHRGENTHDVWLSCHLLEVTNGGIFLPWSCFANPHPVSRWFTSCLCESFTVEIQKCSYFAPFLSALWIKYKTNQDFQNILLPGVFFNRMFSWRRTAEGYRGLRPRCWSSSVMSHLSVLVLLVWSLHHVDKFDA